MTQPEQTSSASSPVSRHITSDVPATKPAIKQPGRVPFGKRVAELSRKACKAKKEAKAATTDTSTAPDTTTSKTAPDNNKSGYYILGIGSLIVSALGVYYQREAITKALGCNQQKNNTSTQPSPTTSQPAPSPATSQPAPKIEHVNKNNFYNRYIHYHVWQQACENSHRCRYNYWPCRWHWLAC